MILVCEDAKIVQGGSGWHCPKLLKCAMNLFVVIVAKRKAVKDAANA